MTGRVTDEQGRPVPDADVVAAPLTSPAPGSLEALFRSDGLYERSQTQADAEGNFLLKDLRDGPVWVRAMEVSGLLEESAPVELPPGRDEVTLVMPRKSTLQGTVVDSEGKPVEDLLIWVGDEPAFNPSGRLEDVVVPEGRSTVTLVAEGFAAERRTVQVPARTAFRLEAPIVLQPERTVSGRVLKEDGCTPIPGAVVMLDPEEPPAHDTKDPLATLTDAEGRFTLGGLKREPLVLRVIKEPGSPWGPRGGVSSVRQPVAAGEDSVTIRFGPEASLSGVVTDREGRPLRGGLLGTSCTLGYTPIDAAGRYVLHGLEGGRECFLSVNTSQEVWPSGPPVFTPRRAVLPRRGMLRVDLAARRGPAAVKVRLPHPDAGAFLLEGEVPMPETWSQFVQRTHGAMRPDPEPSVPGGPKELSFGELSPGRYTLLVIRSQPGSSDMEMVRVPVTLAGPGVTPVDVDFAAARAFKTD